MTKRSGSVENKLSKKSRKEEKSDDWDDSDVDHCLIMASQICEQSVCSTSKIPNYAEFERNTKSTNVYCSTQVRNNMVFTSNNWQNKEIRNDEKNPLQEKYLAKVGEVTILRNEIKTVKTKMEIELSKKKEEWTESIKKSNQKINTLQSELEFKELEITKLKRKLSEINISHKLNLSISSIQHPNEDKKLKFSGKEDKLKEYDVDFFYPVEIKNIPLIQNNNNFQNFGYFGREKYFINNLEQLYLLPYLHGVLNIDTDFTKFKLLNLDESKYLNFPNLCQNIRDYFNNCEEKLNAVNNSSIITQMLASSYFFLESFSSFIDDVRRNIQNKDIRQADNLYLEDKLKCSVKEISLLDSRPICDCEIGISARQSIALIAITFPYNEHLRNHLIYNKNFDTHFLQNILKQPCEKALTRTNYFLKQILHIVKIIGEIRKSHSFSGFLSAVINLLICIIETNNFKIVHELVLDIVKEIIFSRPDFLVLDKLSCLIHKGTVYNEFTTYLCNKPTEERTLTNLNKDETYYFNSRLNFNRRLFEYIFNLEASTEQKLQLCFQFNLSSIYSQRLNIRFLLCTKMKNHNSCILQVFCVLAEAAYKKSYDNNVNFSSNFIKILSNVLESNCTWTHYREKEHNDCLSRLSRLFIDITYNLLQTVKTELFVQDDLFPCGNYKQHIDTLKISLKIMYTLNTHSASDLIVKYVGSYSQYKYIINTLLDLKNPLKLSDFETELLESFQASEEDTVMLRNFENILLWDKV